VQQAHATVIFGAYGRHLVAAIVAVFKPHPKHAVVHAVALLTVKAAHED
jgi:uncharacterized membrane protein YgdD (TMEM256/DUF423 family)